MLAQLVGRYSGHIQDRRLREYPQRLAPAVAVQQRWVRVPRQPVGVRERLEGQKNRPVALLMAERHLAAGWTMVTAA